MFLLYIIIEKTLLRAMESKQYIGIQSQKISYDTKLKLVVNPHIITRIKNCKVLDNISKDTGY